MHYKVENILHAARNGIPIIIKTHTLPPQTEAAVEEILILFLKQLDQEGLKDHLGYCLRELMVNAKKANTKRVYFQDKGMNIEDPKDYERGMKAFKEDTLSNIDYFLSLQEENNLYIRVSFQIVDKVLKIQVSNNVPITAKELTRVYDRVARSRVFQSMDEALSEIMDDSEGAGLGIVIMILMLRKLGLTEKAFDLREEGGLTISSLNIPMDTVKVERINLLSQEIVKTVDTLPPFPENIQTLIAALESEDADFSDLARQITLDPALTTDLLKFVNSAFFGSSRRVESIQEAVKMVGLKGLRNLIYPYGTQKILPARHKEQKALWQRSLKVAQYAGIEARNRGLSREEQGEAHVAGLLHNLGQVIISLVHPSLSQRITAFCRLKNIPIQTFEDLVAGLNHGEIGAMVGEKWQFPTMLIQVMRFNGAPRSALPEFRRITALINLVASFVDIESGVMSYSQIDVDTLRIFSIANLDDTIQIHNRIRKSYNQIDA